MFTAVSLLLFVLNALLWIRSYFTADVVEWKPVGRIVRFHSNNGGFAFENRSLRMVPGQVPALLAGHGDYSQPPFGWHWESGPSWHGLGAWRQLYWFEFFWFTDQLTWDPAFAESKFDIGMPYWVPVGASLVLPVGWSVVTLRRRRRDQRSGQCRKCGYDLRASHDRCPECGTSIV